MNAVVPAVDAGITAREREAGLPWSLYAAAAASTSIVVGLIWDISWHRSIGRDTFWTPAHMAIYLGGILAGLSGGYMALKTTFAGTAEERAASVKFWGFRAPLGAWIAIWGAIAMLTSAPFDNWWHNAYGLDVEIISPPHTVLAMGMIAIQLSAMLLALASQNRAASGRHRRLGMAYVYSAGIMLTMIATMFMEYGFPNQQHRALFYKISCAAYPALLVAVARASKLAWPATAAAGAYMAVSLAMIWILPLFPAQPLLAPIFNPIDRMVPPPFPLLLVVPALAIDSLVRRVGRGRDWLLAVLLAAAFLGVLILAQWFFAEFMLTPHARNWFFAADRWNFFNRIGDLRYRFWRIAEDPVTPRAMGGALLLAAISSRIGLLWGNWMARVVR